MNALTPINPCTVVDLSGWRAKPRREEAMEHRTIALTAEAWRVLAQMTEDAAVASRLAAFQCERELDSAAAKAAEKDAVFFEGVLAAIRRPVF